MQDEKKLLVYRESLGLCIEIYKLKYPKEEIYGLQSQIRRASTSISLLIAEGCGRRTPKDFIHFLVQARGSAKEIMTALELSKNLNFINERVCLRLSDKTNHIASMLTNLIKKIDEKRGS